MAASGDATGPRFVGSVVDPAVLEGAETEPEVRPGPIEPGSGDDVGPVTGSAPVADDGEPPPHPSPGEHPPPSPRLPPAAVEVAGGGDAEAQPRGLDLPLGDTRTPSPRGADMRARLLERARAALGEQDTSRRPAPALTGLDEVDPAGAPPLSSRDHELALLGRPAWRAGAAVTGAGPGALSPTMTAVVGTLIGLAGVASLVALAMHVDRRLPRGSLASAASAPAASAAPAPSSAPVAPTARRRERRVLPGPWRVADDREKPGLRVVKGTIGRQAFLTAVQEAGIGRTEAYRLVKAYEGVRDLDRCGRGDSFLALVERTSGRLRAFEYVVSAEEVYQARENAEGLLRAARLDLKIAYESFPGAFVVDGPLDAAAAAAGFEPGLRDTLARALAGHLDLDDVGGGDRLRVIAQEVTVLGAFARYAGIEALEIVPRNPKRPRQRFYYFKGAKERGYYDARGRAPYEGGWRHPVPGAPVTSHFNPNRMHPVLKRRMPHNGTDFGAPTGAPVHASSFGRVSFVGWGGPAGNLIRIEHPGQIETLYFHLSRFEPGLAVGDHVDRLQVIGYVGSTGRSTGPHLHFGVKKNGKYVDPMSLNLDALRVIASEERDAFAVTVKRYDAALDAIPLPESPPAPSPVAAAIPPGSASAAIGEGEEGEDDAVEAPGTAPAAPASAAVAAGPGAPPTSAVFLTDKELLELQGASSDGEVPE